MAGLKEWFKQDWVDIGAKRKAEVLNVEENLQVVQTKVSKGVPVFKKIKESKWSAAEEREVNHKVLVKTKSTLERFKRTNEYGRYSVKEKACLLETKRTLDYLFERD